MIDALSTNKTDFFREPGHFQYLMRELLPRLVADGLTKTETPQRIAFVFFVLFAVILKELQLVTTKGTKSTKMIHEIYSSPYL